MADSAAIPSTSPVYEAPRLLTRVEVADRLRITTKTLDDTLLATGALPHLRIGRSVRICPADLEAFIEARRTGRSRATKGPTYNIPVGRPGG